VSRIHRFAGTTPGELQVGKSQKQSCPFFWGRKLIDRLAEEILAAIKSPKEAIFKPEEQG
jgi:hypothetical protein